MLFSNLPNFAPFILNSYNLSVGDWQHDPEEIEKILFENPNIK